MVEKKGSDVISPFFFLIEKQRSKANEHLPIFRRIITRWAQTAT